MPESIDDEPPRDGPIFDPPPMWAPTAQKRLGNYPTGWKLNTPQLFKFRSATGCFYTVGFVITLVAILLTVISRIASLTH